MSLLLLFFASGGLGGRPCYFLERERERFYWERHSKGGCYVGRAHVCIDPCRGGHVTAAAALQLRQLSAASVSVSTLL